MLLGTLADTNLSIQHSPYLTRKRFFALQDKLTSSSQSVAMAQKNPWDWNNTYMDGS